MAARFTEGLNLTRGTAREGGNDHQRITTEIQEIRQKSKPEEASVKIQTLIREKLKGILTEDQKRKLERVRRLSPERRGSREGSGLFRRTGRRLPVSVVIGITDGTFSEIISGDLSEGTEVIVGESGEKQRGEPGTPSPFGGGPGGMRK